MTEIIKKCDKHKSKSEKRKQRKYIKKCCNCKSIFTYQNEDIKKQIGFLFEWREVRCPVCEADNEITFKIRYLK